MILVILFVMTFYLIMKLIIEYTYSKRLTTIPFHSFLIYLSLTQRPLRSKNSRPQIYPDKWQGGDNDRQTDGFRLRKDIGRTDRHTD